MRALLVFLIGCAAAPTPVVATYLGVAGWQLEANGRVVMSDPYFTRPTNLDAPAVPDPAAIAAHAPPRADLILVGHSHIDHLLDAPSVALRTGAVLMGSPTTIRVGTATGVPASQLIAVKDGDRREVAGIGIRVIRSLHSLIGLENVEMPDPVTLPLSIEGYKEGGTLTYLVTLGGRTILIFDTANFVEDALAGVHPDIAIIAPGAREKVPDYTCRLMRVLANPPIVLVTHFDAWHGPPVDAPSDDAASFANEVHTCSPKTRVIVPKHFERLTL